MNIHFLNQHILYFLFALIIPVIIHLFSFRRFQTVYFSNFKFLKNIIHENNKTRSKLKQILILISRLLALAFLIIAFANPYIPVNDTQKEIAKNVGIYIDNSFSMTAENQYGKLLDQAKQKAAIISKSHPASSSFFIFNNEFSALDEVALNQNQVQEKIANIKTTPFRRKFSEVISRAKSLLSNFEDNNTLYIITDLQENISDIENIVSDTNISLVFIPIAEPAIKNIYIDSCWFKSPHRKVLETDQVSISIKNIGPNTYTDIPIKLFINDTLKSLSTVTIGSNGSTEVELNFTNNTKGNIYGSIEIADFPVIYDNIYYFSYKIPEKIKILLINENKYIESVFMKDSSFSLSKISQEKITYASLNNFNILFLSNIQTISSGLQSSLLKFLETGGSIVVSPSVDMQTDIINNFISIAHISYSSKTKNQTVVITNINKTHYLFENTYVENNEKIDYPLVNTYFNVTIENKSSTTTLLSLKNGVPFLTASKYNNGTIFLYNTALSDSITDFINHPLFIPATYNMALYSTGKRPIQWSISQENHIPIYDKIQTETVTVKSNKDDFSFIPTMENDALNNRKNVHLIDEIEKAGHYFIQEGKRVIQPLSFNYSREESNTKYRSVDNIKEYISDNNASNISVLTAEDSFISDSIQHISIGIQLWKYFIIACFLFICIEIALIRFL